MRLSEEDIDKLSQHAISAASRAGNIIFDYNREKVVVRNKTFGLSDVDKLKTGTSLASQVVTEVDLLSQQIILDELLPTCKIYDLALLTEETPDDLGRLEKDYFWCIDPLDGTLPFIESVAGYAVSIALVSKLGIPIIGVVFDPLEKTLYHAIKGKGVYRNKLPWSLNISSAKTSGLYTIITDRSFLKHRYFDACVDEITSFALELGFKEIELIKHGGAVMNACWVLEKTTACYFKFPKPETGGGSLWDYAATSCIFNEIGAKVSDIYGKALDLNYDGSTFMNHCGIVFASDRRMAKRIVDSYTKFLK